MAGKIDPNVKKVITALNKARSMELQGIHQYMVQHYILSDLDYGTLCANVKLIAVDEMRHAEKFAERVESLGGAPTCDKAGSIVQGQGVKDIFTFDINLESHTIETYEKLAELCRKCDDSISAALFETIIQQEDIHLGYYKETASHIASLGDAFLAKCAATSKHTGPIKSCVEVMAKEDF